MLAGCNFTLYLKAHDQCNNTLQSCSILCIIYSRVKLAIAMYKDQFVHRRKMNEADLESKGSFQNGNIRILLDYDDDEKVGV